ncbi:MAG TPA: hypothetical protein VIF88_13715 [Methylocystis sp.]
MKTNYLDTGPLIESNAEIWEDIEAALAKGKVEIAAISLRRHLEVSRLLADQLGNSPQFRSDGNYELGELLPRALTLRKKLYGKAADAAQSWANDGAKEDALIENRRCPNARQPKTRNNWPSIKSCYNEWANFGKKDFAPFVAAFKELLNCFRYSVGLTVRLEPTDLIDIADTRTCDC